MLTNIYFAKIYLSVYCKQKINKIYELKDCSAFVFQRQFFDKKPKLEYLGTKYRYCLAF